MRQNKLSRRSLYVFPVLILVFMTLSSMCPNNAPVIISLTATPADLDWGETSQIVVTATDDEGDVLSYLWVCHEGEFTTPTTNREITWQAPDATGSYTITIYVSDEENTASQSITIAVTAHPNFNVSPTSLDFGETSTSLNLSITNSGTGELTWEAEESETWLSVSPESGSTTSETDLINVTVNRTGLDPGTYTTTINITSNEDPMTGPALARTYNATINVQMEVLEPPELSVSPTELDFGETTTALTFDITNSGGGTLNWSITDNAAWLSTSPTSGSTTTETDAVSVNIDRSGLAAGHYDGLITVTSNDGTETIDVDMDVTYPELSVSVTSMDFGETTTALPLNITNSGEGTLTWSITDNAAWLSTSLTSGSTTTEIDAVSVNVDRSGLAGGHYDGLITVTSNDGTATVDVDMDVEVLPPGQWIIYDDENYEGYFDTNDTVWFILTLFDKPAGWGDYKVTEVRINFNTDGNPDGVAPCCWDVLFSSGYYWPNTEVYYNEPEYDVVNGWNTYTVDWDLTLERFFAGYFQLYYATDPDPYYDDSDPDTRAYLIDGPDNNNLTSHLYFGFDWAIQVYVVPETTPEGNAGGSEGMWLEGKKIVIKNRELNTQSQLPLQKKLDRKVTGMRKKL